MSRPRTQLPAGHVLAPALAIGALSLVLAAGLGALGFIGRLDALVARLVLPVNPNGFPKSLPVWSLWLAAGVFALALPLAILAVSGTWRRIVLWVSALVLIAGWVPVLGLAARAPDVSMPFIVALWAGVCALVYATNHPMDSDAGEPAPQNPPPEPPHEAG